MVTKILSFLGMACSSLAIAGTMGPACVPGSVVLPCEASYWEFGVDALYLKPAYTSLAFAPQAAEVVANTQGFAPITNITSFQRINPDWGWGYRLAGAYHFGTGVDLDLEWSHYDVDHKLGTYTGDYYQLFSAGRTATLALPVIPVETTYGLSISNNYDQVNMVMGQAVHMGLRKNARFYGGLQYAAIRVDRTSTYNITEPLFLLLTGGSVQDFNSTDFKGIGPVIGIDYSYDLLAGLSITATTAGSLLYGSSRFDLTTAYGNGLVIAETYGNKRVVVTGWEAKLGANYGYAFLNGLFNLEGGYQVVNYFSPLEAQPVFAGSLVKSNFGLFGPYFGVSWLG